MAVNSPSTEPYLAPDDLILLADHKSLELTEKNAEFIANKLQEIPQPTLFSMNYKNGVKIQFNVVLMTNNGCHFASEDFYLFRLSNNEAYIGVGSSKFQAYNFSAETHTLKVLRNCFFASESYKQFSQNKFIPKTVTTMKIDKPSSVLQPVKTNVFPDTFYILGANGFHDKDESCQLVRQSDGSYISKGVPLGSRKHNLTFIDNKGKKWGADTEITLKPEEEIKLTKSTFTSKPSHLVVDYSDDMRGGWLQFVLTPDMENKTLTLTMKEL